MDESPAPRDGQVPPPAGKALGLEGTGSKQVPLPVGKALGSVGSGSKNPAEEPADKDDGGIGSGKWRPKGWTFHSTFEQYHKERIMQATDTRSGITDRGACCWFGHYKVAASEVKKKLTAEENKEIEELLALWNEQGPGETIQAE